MMSATDVSPTDVILYTTDNCGLCVAAKRLLERRGIAYRQVNLGRDPEERAELVRRTGLMTFPQVVVGDQTLGGFQELNALDRQGALGQLAA